MNVDIYIREREGSREIRIPWLPDVIEYESGGTTFCSFDILDRGEVQVPTASGLEKVRWSSIFPGQYRNDRSMMRGSWKTPATYHNILNDWRQKGTSLNLLVTGYPINMDVILEDYSAAPAGGFGDMEYSLSFIQERDLTITASEQPAPKRATATVTDYTIKSGDTLWSIAERFLGDGSKWETIYNLNKDIIESTAKARWKAAGINRDSQHGHWIFPGTVIKIPSSGSGSSSSGGSTSSAGSSKGSTGSKNTGSTGSFEDTIKKKIASGESKSSVRSYINDQFRKGNISQSEYNKWYNGVDALYANR